MYACLPSPGRGVICLLIHGLKGRTGNGCGPYAASWLLNGMSSSARSLKYLLGWLIAGTRGGMSRARIINALNERPLNANQLATLLDTDYRNVRHHLEVLLKNGIITAAGEGYGMVYFLSPTMESNWSVFEEILKKISKK